jgi:2-C-methyl-D-erythritol 4-phosphate cytidylyltransferase
VPPAEPPIVWTIVVAGGSGTRFGAPKQYADLTGERVIDRSVSIASTRSLGVVAVVPASDLDAERVRIDAVVVAGGASRAASVRAGLAAVPAEATVICVHDAARPFADAAMFDRVIDAVGNGAAAAIPVVPVTDTIKRVVAGRVVDTPPRDELVAVQTPQAFAAGVLRAAHEGDPDATDDAALVERLGGTVVVVPGSSDNRKITHPDDLDWARRVAATLPR